MRVCACTCILYVHLLAEISRFDDRGFFWVGTETSPMLFSLFFACCQMLASAPLFLVWGVAMSASLVCFLTISFFHSFMCVHLSASTSLVSSSRCFAFFGEAFQGFGFLPEGRVATSFRRGQMSRGTAG